MLSWLWGGDAYDAAAATVIDLARYDETPLRQRQQMHYAASTRGWEMGLRVVVLANAGHASAETLRDITTALQSLSQEPGAIYVLSSESPDAVMQALASIRHR